MEQSQTFLVIDVYTNESSVSGKFSTKLFASKVSKIIFML